MRLRGLSEGDLIRALASGLPPDSSIVVTGIGDDGAVVRLAGGEVQVVTTDALVEGVDFLVGEAFSFDRLGHKALAVNLSDIAAMGATPQCAVVTLCISDRCDVESMVSLYQGLGRLAAQHGVSIVGGDLSSSPHDLMISVTLFGKARADEVIRRSGAREGDLAVLFGRTGESGAGLAILGGAQGDPHGSLVERHLRPEPLVAQGRWLATSTGDGVHAMIDVSDGLAADLPRICEASGTGALVEYSAMPVTDELSAFCAANGQPVENYLLRTGEDFALLAAVDPSAADQIAHRFREAFPETPVNVIGSFTGKNDANIRYPDGRVEPLTGGFDHFS